MTYSYYVGEFLGGVIPSCAFPRLANRAGEYLDMVTFGRSASLVAQDKHLSNACCAVAEVMYANEQSPHLISASNNGISETYAQETTSVQKKMYEAALRYLGNAGIMYRGV